MQFITNVNIVLHFFVLYIVIIEKFELYFFLFCFEKIIEGIEVTPKFLENKAWLKIIYSVFAPDILLEVITKERLLTGTAETKITCLSTFSVIVKKIGTIYSYITKTVIKNIFHANLSQYLIKVRFFVCSNNL